MTTTSARKISLAFFCTLFLAFSSQLFAVTQIPFEESNWTAISIGSNKDNTFEFGKSLKVTGDASDSPVLHKLDSAVQVKSFDVSFQVENSTLEDALKSATSAVLTFPEDSILKIGFVAVGDNQLGAMGKLFAPKWVKNVFDLAPEGKGIDKVYFQNFVIDKNQIGQERVSPKSKYMHESVVSAVQNQEAIYQIALKKPLEVSGIWISSDSDDTKRKGSVTIRSLILK